MSSKEEIKEAARKWFKTKEIDLGDGVKITLREISIPEYNALRKRIFKSDDKGELMVEDGSYLYLENAHVAEEWLAATMLPEHTVDDLLNPAWPESLKLELRREAMILNGITVKDAVGNS